MFCEKCGAKLNDDVLFCYNCGSKQNRKRMDELETPKSAADTQKEYETVKADSEEDLNGDKQKHTSKVSEKVQRQKVTVKLNEIKKAEDEEEASKKKIPKALKIVLFSLLGVIIVFSIIVMAGTQKLDELPSGMLANIDTEASFTDFLNTWTIVGEREEHTDVLRPYGGDKRVLRFYANKVYMDMYSVINNDKMQIIKYEHNFKFDDYYLKHAANIFEQMGFDGYGSADTRFYINESGYLVEIVYSNGELVKYYYYEKYYGDAEDYIYGE